MKTKIKKSFILKNLFYQPF